MIQPEGLIRVLLDAEAAFGDRHDAAMDLGAFDDRGVEEALAHLACHEGADEDLADACGESLAEIWCRKGNISREILTKLTPMGLRAVMAALRVCSPRLRAEAAHILSASC